MADRLVGALTSQVFKETKRTGRAAGKKNDLANEKEDVLKGTEWEREKKKTTHIEAMEKCNLLTIWLGGLQQPSSVFLELCNTANYSVRKIKESQRAVEGKKEQSCLIECWRTPKYFFHLEPHHFIVRINAK